MPRRSCRALRRGKGLRLGLGDELCASIVQGLEVAVAAVMHGHGGALVASSLSLLVRGAQVQKWKWSEGELAKRADRQLGKAKGQFVKIICLPFYLDERAKIYTVVRSSYTSTWHRGS